MFYVCLNEDCGRKTIKKIKKNWKKRIKSGYHKTSQVKEKKRMRRTKKKIKNNWGESYFMEWYFFIQRERDRDRERERQRQRQRENVDRKKCIKDAKWMKVNHEVGWGKYYGAFVNAFSDVSNRKEK